MNPNNPRIEKLRLQRQQINERIKSMEAKERTQERKLDTRRKILLGALLSDWMEKDEGLKKKVFGHLTRYLSRKNDRDLFGLSQVKEASDSKLPVQKGGKA